MENTAIQLSNIAALIFSLQEQIKEYEIAGFANCENVVQMRKQLAGLCYDKYKHKYPTYLYFSDEVFNDIIKKNKLIISTSETYTGNIPAECFEAIKNENISKEDFRADIKKISIESSKTKKGFSYQDSEDNFEHIFHFRMQSIRDFDNSQIEDFYIKLKRYQNIQVNDEEMCYIFYGDNTKYSYIYNSKRDFLDRERTRFYITIETVCNNSALYIAAPAYQIDLSKKELPLIEKFKTVVLPKPKDPIVFRYVKDGVLVISFWE